MKDTSIPQCQGTQIDTPGANETALAPTESDDATIALPESSQKSLKRVITTRQFIFMALASSIGAGLLLSTGQALAVGGPAPLFIAFAIIGFAVWITMCNLGELSTNFPVTGSFYEFSVRFISPSWGFAMGWNYVLNFVFVVPFEIIVMIMCASFWNPDISASYLVFVFIIGLIIIYSFGARWFAEAENIFGILKIIVIAIFVVTAILIATRSVSTDTRPVGDLAYNGWRNEAFKNGASGFLFVFMSVGMAYGGTEMLGLTAAECRSPRYVMGLVSKLVVGRIILLYLLPVLMLGLVLKMDLSQAPSDDTTITEDSSRAPLISPFVLAVAQAKIPILPDVMNAVIVVSIFSMANASIFASSRALQAISARGMGPRFCAVLHWDRPVGALAVVFTFSFLAFAKASNHGDEVFVWLLALASCSNYLTWSSICVSQIRCQLAIKRQGKSLSDPEAYRSPFGIAGSIFAVTIFAFGLTAQIVAAVKSPLPSPPPVAASFLGLVVVAIFWVGYMIWKRDGTLLVPLDQIELGSKEEIVIMNAIEEVEHATARLSV
ncbi:amino acid permease/ SLC12A domain-containing protein [Xylariaceae sp. AK1471]|nr:amino acid permease/ SLC12A domain-containing protein [Xylariaceae sp. AK1471]